jgi:hypothetical protein
VLRLGCEALHALAPAARAVAVASLDAASPGRIAACEAAAGAESERRALHAALLAPGSAGAGTAAGRVIDAVHAAGEAWSCEDSRAWPGGAAALTDWAAAASGDASAAFVTAPLVVNHAVLGVACLRLQSAAAAAPAAEPLRRLCLAIAAAVVARRERDAADAARNALSLAQDVFPQHIVAQITRQREARGHAPHADSIEEETATDLMIDRYDSVTVIFADGARRNAICAAMCMHAPADVARRCVAVVTWTAIAGALQPEQAMRVLDRLFQRVDTLAVSHGTLRCALLCFALLS